MTDLDGLHDSASFHGFDVDIARADPELGYANHDPSNDIVIHIDTPADFTGELRVRINDALVYRGNPEDTETVLHTADDGYFVQSISPEDTNKRIFVAADGSWGNSDDIRLYSLTSDELDKVVKHSETNPIDAIYDINEALKK